ncbi:hypothetical protein [Parendozoicomonas haliclonae]|uniref:Uncharacterized protein n=1 Tax=Parendozoicomonas haliclonae TaxID=1960125 RepID=A0A1X7AS83_9GAMM|nr:hypothetical protein [Parendozoicomonas haliclonae]SMA50958.1 hypothetical protein EHSB41UT_04779 [Parendozoicomonas haliclonae]
MGESVNKRHVIVFASFYAFLLLLSTPYPTYAWPPKLEHGTISTYYIPGFSAAHIDNALPGLDLRTIPSIAPTLPAICTETQCRKHEYANHIESRYLPVAAVWQVKPEGSGSLLTHPIYSALTAARIDIPWSMAAYLTETALPAYLARHYIRDNAHIYRASMNNPEQIKISVLQDSDNAHLIRIQMLPAGPAFYIGSALGKDADSQDNTLSLSVALFPVLQDEKTEHIDVYVSTIHRHWQLLEKLPNQLTQKNYIRLYGALQMPAALMQDYKNIKQITTSTTTLDQNTYRQLLLFLCRMERHAASLNASDYSRWMDTLLEQGDIVPDPYPDWCPSPSSATFPLLFQDDNHEDMDEQLAIQLKQAAELTETEITTPIASPLLTGNHLLQFQGSSSQPHGFLMKSPLPNQRYRRPSEPDNTVWYDPEELNFVHFSHNINAALAKIPRFQGTFHIEVKGHPSSRHNMASVVTGGHVDYSYAEHFDYPSKYSFTAQLDDAEIKNRAIVRLVFSSLDAFKRLLQKETTIYQLLSEELLTVEHKDHMNPPIWDDHLQPFVVNEVQTILKNTHSEISRLSHDILFSRYYSFITLFPDNNGTPDLNTRLLQYPMTHTPRGRTL